jgi:carboxyl-terminal processing protease
MLEEDKQNHEQNENEYSNSKRTIFTPLILSAVLIAGIFIGNFLIPSKHTTLNTNFSNLNNNKISSVLRLVQENYVDKISIDSIQELAIPLILQNLDPHSAYFPPKVNEAEHERLSGNFEGIGVQFNIKNDTILIVNTISGGPSEKVGVLPGDRIVTINDSLFAGTGITNDEVMGQLKGPKGTEVTIGVKRRGIKDLIEFTIVRDEIPLYSVDVSYMADDDIGYIKISRFAGTTYEEFMQASTKLMSLGMKKLILDLRDNGGGYLSTAVDIIDEFLAAGKMIVYTEGAFRNKFEYKSSSSDFLKDIELVVLINSWSASASEIVSGAIQDNDRGLIIGRRSFGKGLVQEEFTFSDNSGVRITIARYYTPVGRSIQKPYENGSDSYFHDIYKRALGGELAEQDSIMFPDSLKFTTPGGNTVYGGGGIMPDIFVPVDTSGYSDYYYDLTRKGLIYTFALNYADQNRKKLNEFTDYKQINDYLNKSNILNEFIKYSVNEGVQYNRSEFKISEKIIFTMLKAYTARNIIDNDGYFPIMKDVDIDVLKAIEILNDSK